jgi:hypothetical protein
MKKVAILIVLLLVLPCMAFAMDLDLRFKGGAAAGVDEMNIDSFILATGSGDSSRNFQVELAFIALEERRVSPVFTIGIFDREHSGTVSDPFVGLPSTFVDYNVQGVSFGAGVRVKATENLHFEGRIEAGAGEGKPDLSTPGMGNWNDVEEDAYASFSFIVGSYYTFSMPQIQLGLEVGVQSFSGDFQIWNSGGYWADADVSGGGGIMNLVAGYRF